MQRIINLSPANCDQDYPEVILHNNSRIPDRTRAIVFQEPSPMPELKRTFRYFNDLGMEVALLGCMTAHYYYAELARMFRGTLLNAPEIVLEELTNNEQHRSKSKIGIVGSTGLLRSGIFQEKLRKRGFQSMTLNDEEQEHYFMQPLYRPGGIKTGVLAGDHVSLFLQQFDILTDRGCELIIGACSEIPLVLPQATTFPYLDAFDLLASKAVQHCYNNQETVISVYH